MSFIPSETWSDGGMTITNIVIDFFSIDKCKMPLPRESGISSWLHFWSLPITQERSDEGKFVKVAKYEYHHADVKMELTRQGSSDRCAWVSRLLLNDPRWRHTRGPLWPTMIEPDGSTFWRQAAQYGSYWRIVPSDGPILVDLKWRSEFRLVYANPTLWHCMTFPRCTKYAPVERKEESFISLSILRHDILDEYKLPLTLSVVLTSSNEASALVRSAQDLLAHPGFFAWAKDKLKMLWLEENGSSGSQRWYNLNYGIPTLDLF